MLAIRSRVRLGLSAKDFGRLAGVSAHPLEAQTETELSYVVNLLTSPPDPIRAAILALVKAAQVDLPSPPPYAP